MIGAGVNAVWPDNDCSFVTAACLEPQLKLHSSNYHTATTALISLEAPLNGQVPRIDRERELTLAGLGPTDRPDPRDPFDGGASQSVSHVRSISQSVFVQSFGRSDIQSNITHLSMQMLISAQILVPQLPPTAASAQAAITCV